MTDPAPVAISITPAQKSRLLRNSSCMEDCSGRHRPAWPGDPAVSGLRDTIISHEETGCPAIRRAKRTPMAGQDVQLADLHSDLIPASFTTRSHFFISLSMNWP